MCGYMYATVHIYSTALLGIVEMRPEAFNISHNLVYHVLRDEMERLNENLPEFEV